MIDKKPDFIGLGAQKAATSWIHACLYEHPEIYMPARKEIHFFSRHYSKGPRWYKDQFRACKPSHLAGEFSPTYLYDPATPKRIFEWNPDIKLIVCLRNPVERAISAYHYEIKMGVVPLDMSFDEATRAKPAYLEHGLYYEQIGRYLQYFKREQVLITIYEDIVNDPYKFIAEICEFLGVDRTIRSSMLTKRVNESDSAPRFDSMDRLLKSSAACLREIGMGHLVWTLGQSKAGRFIRQTNTRKLQPERLTQVRRQALQRLFTQDIRALEKLLERDLGHLWFNYSRYFVENSEETNLSS